MITDILVAIVAWMLVAGGCLYGCASIPPGSWQRWPIYGGCSVILTQFGWFPLLPFFGFHVGAFDQWAAILVATVGLKVVMEKLVPVLLWGAR